MLIVIPPPTIIGPHDLQPQPLAFLDVGAEVLLDSYDDMDEDKKKSL